MAHVLIMPRQGNTVESCIIQEWKVQEGAAVKADTTVCVVETDKAAFDIPAGADGQILKILRPGGDDVPVLEPIAIIGKAGEDWQAAIGTISTKTSHEGTKAQSSIDELKKQEVFSSSSPVCDKHGLSLCEGSSGISPRARKLVAMEGIVSGTITGTGPGGRIIERDVKAALAERAPLTAAAKAAAMAGSPVPSTGTGLGGRITSEDMALVKAHAEIPEENLARSLMTRQVISDEGKVTETPIKGIRKIIADRMIASLSESAQLSLNASANAVQLQQLRKWLKSKDKSKKDNERELAKITINDLILYVVSRVLPSHQYMNAHKIGDVIRHFERVHLGMAVDTPRGLMVPVIRNANCLSLKQISCEAKRLASACQNGSVKPDELTGSTFTISNLGNYGITGFTPVLNLPEVAILGVCGIELKPVESLPAENPNEEECAFAFAPHIGFSLTINHQVVDGAPAARFLKALCEAVENVYLELAAG